jgi:hypothetical protein
MSECVLCAFWRVSRSHFCVKVCDNLSGGVPACVVADFYPDTPSMDYSADVVVCGHFVRRVLLSYLVWSQKVSSTFLISGSFAATFPKSAS